MIDKTGIISHIDHTLLSQTATFKQIKEICDEALKFHAASICIPPAYVKEAYEYLKGQIPICTVIGFPNGYNTLEVKAFEAEQAVKNGADEIDMVINIGFLKDGKYDYVKKEIEAVKKACNGKVLKVIVETCYLDENEKRLMCKIVNEAKADYIKTSTGFGTGNATREDVLLFSECLKQTNVKIKASGGIKSFDAAEEFISCGADRLGSSSLIKSLV